MKTSPRNIMRYLAVFSAIFQFVESTPQWYSASDGNEYLIESDNKYNWLQANDECARQDLQLAIVDNTVKNDALDALLRKIFVESPDLWLGHHDEFSTKRDKTQPFYAVSTGKQILFNNWASGEPNNENGLEHCAHIWRTANLKWNDQSCHDSYFGFICEQHHLSIKYKKAMEEKRLSVNQRNTQLSIDYENKQIEIRNIMEGSRNSTSTILVELQQSTDAIISKSRNALNEVIRQKPYLEAVIADLGDTIRKIIVETYNEIVNVSTDARQSMEETLLSAVKATSDVSSEFAYNLQNNKNVIDNLLVY